MDKVRLLEFAEAWQTGDLEKVMSFFTDDCSYFPSVGLKMNTSFNGKKEVSQAIKRIMDYDEVKDVVLNDIMVSQSFGFWKWTYFLKNGEMEVGCDVFEFSEQMIRVKNAFRKVVLDAK